LITYLGWSEGQAKKDWNEALSNAKKAYEGKPTSFIEQRALEAYMGPMSEVGVSKLAEGDWGFFGYGEGIDFPGWGWKNFLTAGSSIQEANAEEYMLHQFKMWKVLHNMQNDTRIFPKEQRTSASSADPQGILTITPSKKPVIKNNNPGSKTNNSNNLPEPPKGKMWFNGQLVDVDWSGLDSLNNSLSADSLTANNVSELNADDLSNQISTVNFDSTMSLASDRGFSQDQIGADRALIIDQLKKDGELKPEATWHMVYYDYLNNSHLYTGLSDYLQSIE
jgi:hypothetical protein